MEMGEGFDPECSSVRARGRKQPNGPNDRNKIKYEFQKGGTQASVICLLTSDLCYLSSDLGHLSPFCLVRHLCSTNYPETILHCHFYYDIQPLSLQHADIPLNHCRFMYRKDMA